MSKEIKAGDWVRVSNVSEDVAQQSPTLYQVTGFTPDGRVMAEGHPWRYAVHPDDVKVLSMEEYKVRIENQTPSTESLEAGQELSHYQVLRWIEKYGSTSGLQYMIPNGLWVGSEGHISYVVDTHRRYRLAPKKANDPDDPTTWENGVAIFVRDSEYDAWRLDVFSHYKRDVNSKCVTKFSVWRYAKLATPEQIEAWKLINEGL